MESLSHYRGAGQFGRAYEAMYRNDSHAPGSVDRVLLDEMVRLCDQTAGDLYARFTPTSVRYRRGSRPALERIASEATAGRRDDEERIDGIIAHCAAVSERAPETVAFGGTEEAINDRGSDLCTDVARLACAVSQVAGMPARLVVLADTDRPYHGHEIVEVFRGGVWGAADPVWRVVYRHPGGRPASAWELARNLALVEAHLDDAEAAGMHAGQFRAVAIVNYFVEDAPKYDYAVSGLNDYYRSIFEQSAKGWPGGARWLHGEDAGSD